MGRAYRSVPALLLMLCAPAASLAQTLPCPAVVAPDGALAAWTAPVDRTAASHPSHIGDIAIGQALHLTLLHQSDVELPLPPGKSGAAGSYAGLLSLTIAEPGRYRVALGTGAWIDLVDHGQAAASISHTHGPTCSGIRKIVDFPLHAGEYTLQISANTEPQTTVLVVRAP